MIRISLSIFIIALWCTVPAGSINDKFGPEGPILFNSDDLSGTNNSTKNEPQVTLGDIDNDGDLDLILFEGLEESNAQNGKIGKFFLLRNEGSEDTYIFNKKEVYPFVTLSTP